MKETSITYGWSGRGPKKKNTKLVKNKSLNITLDGKMKYWERRLKNIIEYKERGIVLEKMEDNTTFSHCHDSTFS